MAQLVVANCRNFQASNLTMNNSVVSAYFAYDNGTVLRDSVFQNTKVVFLSCKNVTVSGSSALELGVDGSSSVFIVNNSNLGIGINASDNVSISGNKYINVDLTRLSFKVKVLSNIVWGAYYCIVVNSAINVTISKNSISNCYFGIDVINGSKNVTITGNNIANNQIGAQAIAGSSLLQNVLFYRNNFINNAAQAPSDNAAFDDGYPIGGNYWSDYQGVDHCSGPQQNNCPMPDGLGDTPYVITPYLFDNYPLMTPYGPLDNAPPTWPMYGLSTSQVTTSSLILTWTDAIDDMGVANYKVYRGDVMIATIPEHPSYVTTRQYSIYGLSPGTEYMFRVEAGDLRDNWSNNGPSMTVRTLDSPQQPANPGNTAGILTLLLQQYWYLIVAAVGSCIAGLAFSRKIRREKVRSPIGAVRSQNPNARAELVGGLHH
jgi:nitrous oxidase accessory protein NosD